MTVTVLVLALVALGVVLKVIRRRHKTKSLQSQPSNHTRYMGATLV